MKILSKEEASKIFMGKMGRDSLLRKWLLELQVGEVLDIEENEWRKPNPPYYIIYNLKKRMGRTFEYNRKRSGGWIFRRTS